jgi:hypothetical protein
MSMIIGFAGKAASGKTTAARFLRDQLGDRVEILPMARMLREEVAAFIRAVGAEDRVPLVYGDQADKVRVFTIDSSAAKAHCPDWDDFVALNRDIQPDAGATAVTVRRILQWWGTEYRRAQNPDYWTQAWENKLQDFDLERTHILVDDVRFRNELDVIKKNDGLFVKIERAGFDGANDHSSENSLDDFDQWDIVIPNDGSLEQFLGQIEARVLPLLK